MKRKDLRSALPEIEGFYWWQLGGRKEYWAYSNWFKLLKMGDDSLPDLLRVYIGRDTIWVDDDEGSWVGWFDRDTSRKFLAEFLLSVMAVRRMGAKFPEITHDEASKVTKQFHPQWTKKPIR